MTTPEEEAKSVPWKRLTMRRTGPGQYAGKFENEDAVGEVEFIAWEEGDGKEPDAVLVAQWMHRDYECDVILETGGDPPQICFCAGEKPWKRESDGT